MPSFANRDGLSGITVIAHTSPLTKHGERKPIALDNNLHACGSRRRGYPCHGTLQPVGPEATGSLGDLEHEHHGGPGLRGQAAQHMA
jgi:hypothetical protein